jgi:RNA polymerase sigma-70 factor (sigma-E family)
VREEDEFREYVYGRLGSLRRIAYLLCDDWHLADDLVSITIGKLYRHWRRVRAADNIDAYVRQVLTRSWLDERRRPWRYEYATARLPDRPAATPDPESVVERSALAELLDSLSPGQRAVIVLRFYGDTSVEETAEILGITPGTVKSQSARGLAAMRALATEQQAKQE